MEPSPEDEVRRDRDPVTSRRAATVAVVVLVSLLALAGGAWLLRPQPAQAPTIARVTPPAIPTAQAPPVITPTPNPTGPVTGFGFSAANDPATHQVVMFGGIDSYATTWLWDGHRWSLAHPAVSPPGRFGAAMAYDPVARVVVLYGGRLGPGDVVDDTWTWDGTSWRQLDSGTGSPPAGEGSAMAWDDRVNEMLLVNSNGGLGGQTWGWKCSRWVRQLSGNLPSGTIVVAMAAGPAAVTLVALTLAGPGRGVSSTFTWDGAAWNSVRTGAAPGDVVGMALDPISHQLLLGNDPQDPALSSTTSLWTGDRWVVVSGAHLPVEPGAMVTDVVDGQVLLLGFVGEPAQGAPQPVHVWAWSGASWTEHS